MLRLVKRCPEYTSGYKEYCQELYANNVIYFRPSNPENMDDGKFVGEFQLRTEFPEKVMLDIGSIGYAVKVSEWGKGYGTQHPFTYAKNWEENYRIR